MAEQRRVFKTKRVLSGVKSQYRAWKNWDEGDVIVCTLQGTKPNKYNAEKSDWIVEVEDAFFSDKKAQKTLLGDGKSKPVLTMNSSGQLDKGMSKIRNGDMVQITYGGFKEMEGGKYAGKDAHLHEVVEVGDEGEGSEEDEEDLL